MSQKDKETKIPWIKLMGAFLIGFSLTNILGGVGFALALGIIFFFVDGIK